MLGAARARELFLTGRWMSADEAVEVGLAVCSVPDGELGTVVAAAAYELPTKSRPCMCGLKAQPKAVEGLGVEDALPIERHISSIM